MKVKDVINYLLLNFPLNAEVWTSEKGNAYKLKEEDIFQWDEKNVQIG